MRTRSVLLAPLFVLILFGPAYSACRELDVAGGFTRSAHAAGADAVVEFYGHNFFQITTAKGQNNHGPDRSGDVPNARHQPSRDHRRARHRNHNYVVLPKETPRPAWFGKLWRQWNKISTTVRDVLIYTVPVYQQQLGNALKGAAFVFDLGTLCIAHLGDLAHKLTARIKALAKWTSR